MASKSLLRSPSIELGASWSPTEVKNERDVKVFTSEGILVGLIGAPGRGNGRFRFAPNHLAVAGQGGVYVVSLKTIQKFGEPSNAFSLGAVKLNRRTGGARVIADVPGVGNLTVEGRGIKATRRRANLAGKVALEVVPNRRLTTKLLNNGRAMVEVRVTYTPTTAGDAHPATRSRRVTLVRER